ncbi:LysR family transcriptional regulator [Pendulispora albinea]|uniref:LysR family transcriptional regulator n=1 Tax=Pendulispora albinea TaxID=2741071 RepID=A0ABZ2LPD6_9BACT
MESWDDLRFFLAVARHKTHAAAANALQVDATTVGRRIRALEEQFDSRLFARTPNGLALTEAGLALAPHAERMESQVLAAEGALGGVDSRLEGVLCLTAGEGLSSYVLAPKLLEFRREHPAIRIEIRAENRTLDLSRREADVAVRLFRPKERSLVARRIGNLTLAVYGSRDYLQRRGRPRKLRDLAAHDWVGFDPSLDRTPPSKWMRRHVPAERWVLRSNTTTVVLSACAAGHGLGLLPSAYVPFYPTLEHVVPQVAVRAEIWAVTHPDIYPSARIKALLAWLGRALPSDEPATTNATPAARRSASSPRAPSP